MQTQQNSLMNNQQGPDERQHKQTHLKHTELMTRARHRWASQGEQKQVIKQAGTHTHRKSNTTTHFSNETGNTDGSGHMVALRQMH